MKIMDKLRKLGKKGKVMLSVAMATMAMAAMSVCAFATDPETSGATDMNTVLSDAGTQLISSFNSLVSTMIPVVLGILGSGLVIFGLFALIKLSKKVFGKVAS